MTEKHDISSSLLIKRMLVAVPFVQVLMIVAFLAIFFLMAAPHIITSELPLETWAQNAGTLIWVVWFPLTLFSVIIIGRAWCGMMCPMGAASEAVGRFGLKLRLPGWARSPATPIVAFMLVTVVAQVMGVRDDPYTTVQLLGTVMLLALAVGFVYGRGRNRPWCRHLCPIGFLLGLYGRMGMIDFRPKRKRQVSEGELYAEKGLCPTMIKLTGKESARHCIECLRCVGGPKDACEIALRRPGAEIEAIGSRAADPWEVLGLFLGTGVALGGFLWLVLPHYLLLRWWLQTLTNPEGWPIEILSSSIFPWLVRHMPTQEGLDGWSIVIFMLTCAFLIGGLLAALTAIAAWLTPSVPSRTRMRTAVALGYQVLPMALGSLLLGLGSRLFKLGGADIRLGLFVVSAMWSLWLGWKILAGLGVSVGRRPVAMLPGLAGVLLLAVLWSPLLGIVDPHIDKLKQFGMPVPEESLPPRAQATGGGY